MVGNQLTRVVHETSPIPGEQAAIGRLMQITPWIDPITTTHRIIDSASAKHVQFLQQSLVPGHLERAEPIGIERAQH